MRAQHMDMRAIGLQAAWCGAPLRLDLGQMGFAPHVIVGMDARGDIGIAAEPGGVAVEIASCKAATLSGTITS
jgi:hypothetical protein